MSSTANSHLRSRTRADVRRRSSSGKLGAVKLPADTADAGPADASSPREPKPDAARAPAAAATAALQPPEHAHVGSGTRRFGQLLSEDRTSDRWLDSQMHQAGGGGVQGLPPRAAAKAPAAPVDSAATQIVQKALKFITLDSGSRSPKLPLASPNHSTMRFKSESASFLDKGLEAINGVGKLMEGFALSLDNVIGQAFDEWGSVPAGGRPAGPAPGRASISRQTLDGARKAPLLVGRSSAAAAGRVDGLDAAAAPPEKENRPQAAPGAPANIAADGRPSDRMRQKLMSPLRSKLGDASEADKQQWLNRVQSLQQELETLRKQHGEYQRVKEEYDKLQAAGGKHAGAGTEGPAPQHAASAEPGPDLAEADALASQQLTAQMEALLGEKSKLARTTPACCGRTPGCRSCWSSP